MEILALVGLVLLGLGLFWLADNIGPWTRNGLARSGRQIFDSTSIGTRCWGLVKWLFFVVLWMGCILFAIITVIFVVQDVRRLLSRWDS